MATTSKRSVEAEIVNSAIRRAVIDQVRPSVSLFIENIADSSNGANELRFERLVDLLPEAADGHVHHVAVRVERRLPHLLGDERPRQHLPCRPRQEREQSELLRAQVELLPGARGAAA